MASTPASSVPVTLDTPIQIKLLFQNNTRKFKIPLRDLGAQTLPTKLRSLLNVPASEHIVFERYSDSVGAYVILDATKPQVYKTLFRAAKAKLKLRLRATVPGQQTAPTSTASPDTVPKPLSTTPSLRRSSEETLSAQPPPPPPGMTSAPVIACSPFPFTTPCSEKICPPFQPASVASSTPAPTVEAKATPSPRAITEQFFSRLAAATHPALAVRPKIESGFQVYCNNCNLALDEEHFHCSICDQGDYDLCSACVDSGIHCPGAGHWMVKRFIKDGSVVSSTTERVPPKVPSLPVPGAFTEEKQPAVEAAPEPLELSRTCNACVRVLPEREFVTCTACDDYDLCQACHVINKHGHHPAHAFKPASAQTVMSPVADFLCNAGRNVRHSAVCDGCEKFIYGVRHKCLNCPDWDFCTECIKSSKWIHPGHRFVPIYEPLAEPVNSGNRHYGIYCDGPLCKDKENLSYIEGVRFKCAVCHDTDFCANCEAHPSNRHNHTHPLIKFKRPVRSVSVTTMNEDKNGKLLTKVGDRDPPRRSTATETAPPAPSSNAATQVQTIIDQKPSVEALHKSTKEKIQIRDLLSEPVSEKIAVQDLLNRVQAVRPISITKPDNKSEDTLDAHFIRDTLKDGSKIASGYQFVQVWTLRNPGPNTWPAGCSVRHVGGDNMLNLDNTKPLSQSELAEASESNVVGRPIQPGEEVAFRVLLKAPAREGTAISYWRLKTAEGLPFGHRLWCDIQVVSTPPAVIEAVDKPIGTSEALERMNQKMQQVQKVRRAAIDRLLETRRKEREAISTPKYATLKEAFEQSKAPSPYQATVEEETAELPVEEKQAEVPKQAPEASKPADAAEPAVVQEPQLQSFRMIIPQLEKESPAASTHEAMSSPSEAPAVSVSANERSEDDFFEDAESVELHSFASDDGFLTDEEYDILDASDEEIV